MPWPRRVEQWRQYAVWEGKDIPADLILAIVAHESGGSAGRRAERTCRPGELTKIDGSKVTVNRALGLMQCIPGTIDAYNQRHADQPAYYEDMIGSDERSSRLQIRIGSEVYARNVNALYQYDPVAFPGVSPGSATKDQLKLALTAYAVGFGSLKSNLDELKAQGVPLTYANVARANPNWGRNSEGGEWINRPLHYASSVWSAFTTRGEPGRPGMSHPTNPRGLPELARAARAGKDLLLPLVLIAAAYVFRDTLRKPLTKVFT